MLLADPITLENDVVRLEPLSRDHASDLRDAIVGLEHAWYTSVPTAAGVDAEISRRLEWRDAGRMNPWAVRRLDTGRVVGMTTFCDIDQPNRHVEIGYTWLGVASRRSARPSTRRRSCSC